MEEVGVWEKLRWCWRLRWRRERFEWEFTLVEELDLLVASTVVLKEEKDVKVWRNEEKGCFSVNSTYECLAKHGRGPQHDVFKSLC